MKMKFTRMLPKKPGFYWWTNFGEHTPTVLEVRRDYSSGKLWADNGEYSFEIRKVNRKKIIRECRECKESGLEPNDDGYYYGEQLWCYIPNPFLPGKNGKQIEPDSY